MTQIKVCKFCQKETVYVPITVAPSNALEFQSKRIIKIHYCYGCSAEYVYWSDDGALGSMHLYTTINDKMYRWSTSTGEKLARLWYIAEPGMPGVRPNKKLTMLKSLEEYPDLTPQNVNEKIRFMLPFL